MNTIEQLQYKNEKLSMLLRELELSLTSSHKGPINSKFSHLLQNMISNAEQNCGKYPTNRKHSTIIKKFATALFLYAGPLAYEFLQQNVPQALPCVRTIQTTIHSEYKCINEGAFQFDELKEHIERYGAPAFVSISEDATRIVGRVEYDSATNRCVGFVLPLDGNGLPKVNFCTAESFSAMEEMFQKCPIAKYAYVYMAQPLCQNVPPMCLACLGTDNKFSADDLLPRWRFIVEECSKRNIIVLSFGADGDSRVMKCMTLSTTLTTSDPSCTEKVSALSKLCSPVCIPDNWKGWFHIQPNKIGFVQDTVHLAVKLKSRLLKPRIALPMGKYTATGDHLDALTLKFQKDQHGLRLRDINHKDKQNFQAVINITSASHLLSKIPGANATKCYVELIQHVMDGYLDKGLDPLSRIEKLWYAAFFVHYWRKWLMLNKAFTLKDNFITCNAYMCIELNAHALIVFLIAVRDHAKTNDCFLPWLLGSQCCEAMFRTARSMSSIFSTVINFGMLGLLRRLHRLHIQLALQTDSSEEILFPRVAKRKIQKLTFDILEITNDKILEAVKRGQDKAKLMIEELGMAELFKKHTLWNNEVGIVGIDNGFHEKVKVDDCKDDDENELEDDDNIESNSLSVGCLSEDDASVTDSVQLTEDLSNMAEHKLIDGALQSRLLEQHKFFYKKLPSSTVPQYEPIDKPGSDKRAAKSIKVCKAKFNPFVEVITSSNKKTFIHKTTALWLLQEGERISSDRLFRVRCKQPFSDNLSAGKSCKFNRTMVIADDDTTPAASPHIASSDVIVIDDKGDTEFSELWLRIEGIPLYITDKQVILNGTWLWGTHLSAVQFLLKQKFPNVKGLEDCTFVLREGNVLMPGSVQILHVNGNHWLTVSTMDSDFDVTVYDSLYFTLHESTKSLLAQLLKTSKTQITVKFANTNKQAGDNDCGVFAAAYCTALVCGNNHSSCVYDQKMMRNHLIKRFECGDIQPFPVIRPRRIGVAKIITIKVYCYCRNPDDGSKMVQCNKCKDWFHLSCITSGVTKEKKWHCDNCH